MNKFIYRLYLVSPGWKLTRLIRKKDRCWRCWSLTSLELHHDSYRWHNKHTILRWLIPNLWDAMRTLCKDCHGLEHNA